LIGAHTGAVSGMEMIGCDAAMRAASPSVTKMNSDSSLAESAINLHLSPLCSRGNV
jgi:hypothetical protein